MARARQGRGRVSATQVRAAAWAASVAPALLLGASIVADDLGANPIEAATHFTGLWALRFLVASLAVTPIRKLGFPELAPARRILGLACFAWVSVHFAIYLTLDLGFDFGFLFEDIADRPYITVGFSAWLLLLSLAATSTRAWQRRLGRRWVVLHRAVYPASVLAALHFVWLVKADLREPALYAGLVSLLLGARAIDHLRGRAPARGEGEHATN